MKRRWNDHTIGTSLFVVLAAACGATLAAREASPPLRRDLELSVQREQIVTFAPVIAKIRLTNRGPLAYELSVRNDGAPYALLSMIANTGKDDFEHDQWIRRSGPEKHRLVLAPGDSTSGDILVFFGPRTGFAFGEPGMYHLRFAFQPDSGFAPVHTNQIEISVVPDDLQNRAFLAELSELAYEYFGYDREVVRRNAGDSILIGYQLIHEILKVQGPYFIDPDGDAHNRKQAGLMGKLSEMLERFPDNSYSGYVARFLGLVHINTFEHVFSHGRLESWNRKNLSDEMQAVRNRASVARDTALKYLTMASQYDLWPRTTSSYELGRLHVLSEEWDKVRQCVDKLREFCGAANGAEFADELEREAAHYRSKLGGRTTTTD